MQNSIPQGQVPNIQQMPQQVPQVPQQPCYATAPQIQPQPNYAGVNIQIFNPMVGTPTGAIYPQQTGSAYDAGSQGGCYPSNYYTGQYPQGTFVPQNPYGQVPNAGTTAQSGVYGANGVYYPANPNGYPIPGTTATNGGDMPASTTGEQTAASTGTENSTQTGTTAPTDAQGTVQQAGETDKTAEVKTAETQNGKTPTTDGTDGKDGKVTDGNTSTADDQKAEAGNENNAGTNGADSKKTDAENQNDTTTNGADGKKTEKRKIIELSDDYIKTLENYLNSQDSEVRLMGAKEVVARAMEDESRNDDPALTALVNKMLQDPSAAIRALALSLIDSRTILGNDYTVNVLKNMQTSQAGFGQDSVQATSALLKMAGKTVEKEFEVKETPKTDKK